MAKTQKRTRTAPVGGETPTPQRLARDEHIIVDPSRIDSSEQPIGRAMRLRHVDLLDRWLNHGCIDDKHYAACRRYARIHKAAGFPQHSTVANLTGITHGGGEDTESRSLNSLEARNTLRELLPIIGSRLKLFELAVVYDSYSDVHPDLLSQSQKNVCIVMARHDVMTTSADLVVHWQII
jgi:hypothetical protein